MRKVALAGGIAYLVTFAASIPQLGLFAELIDDPAGFISGTDSNSAVLWGSWLEVITALACIATAVFLYPATRRISKTAAIGFVTSRVTEAALILVGVVSVLSVVTLKADFAGATAAQAETLQIVGDALVTVRRVDLPRRPWSDRWYQRPLPHVRHVQRPPCPPSHSNDRLRGNSPHLDVGDRDDLRRLGADLDRRRPLCRSHRHLGVLTRCLPHRQGLQE